MSNAHKDKKLHLEHIVCDLCGSDDYIVRYRKPDNWLWLCNYEYPVVECVNCGLVYVNPRPPFEEMNKYYPKGYHDGRGNYTHLKRYITQFEYIANYKASRILDIGCARGDWLEYIHARWPDVELHGVDSFSDGVNSENIIFHRKQLDEIRLPESQFSLITAWAVLEHVHTPSIYFSTVSKLLKPGGKFIFLVTNSESFYGKYAYKEDIPRHLYHFSAHSLRGYAKKHDLILEHISYDNRFWDSTGKGLFRNLSAKMLRISWRDIHFKKLSLFSRIILKWGALLDRLVFCWNWESILKKSGIIVVTMSKERNE